MARQRLPGFSFEKGLRLWRAIPEIYGPRPRQDWWLVGRLEDGTPFLLIYAGGGLAQWACAQQLGAGLRKKILNGLREGLRQIETLPEGVVPYDFRAQDEADFNAGCAAAEQVTQAFFRDIWRAQYLDDRDEDYLDLTVPFADKDAAKAVGAVWDSERRTWRINTKRVALSTVSRWLPPSAPTDKENFEP